MINNECFANSFADDSFYFFKVSQMDIKMGLCQYIVPKSVE